jgi:hypothetical protein
VALIFDKKLKKGQPVQVRIVLGTGEELVYLVVSGWENLSEGLSVFAKLLPLALNLRHNLKAKIVKR